MEIRQFNAQDADLRLEALQKNRKHLHQVIKKRSINLRNNIEACGGCHISQRNKDEIEA
ncbi:MULTISPECIES: hypothetical protein [Bacillus]|uniref:hypothetical protein n=1 Tax=Bacillus TaxID=1386 RepID=UPI0003FE5E93|nr:MULTISPECIES: hypothetical protein [Bacillus]